MWVFVDRMPTTMNDAGTLISMAMNRKVLGSFRSVSELRTKFAKKMKRQEFDETFNFILKKSNFSESEGQKLYRRVEAIVGTGKYVEIEQWEKLATKLWGNWVPAKLQARIHQILEDESGSVKVADLLEGIVSLVKGSNIVKKEICFRAFDGDRDGKLTVVELSDMMTAFYSCVGKEFGDQGTRPSETTFTQLNPFPPISFSEMDSYLSGEDEKVFSEVFSRFEKIK